jgi:hypothetical protein
MDELCTIVEDPIVPMRIYCTDRNILFRDNPLRKQLNFIHNFDINATYTLFRTKANPEALETIDAYDRGNRELLQTGKISAYIATAENERTLHLYYMTLRHFAEEQKIPYQYYPLLFDPREENLYSSRSWLYPVVHLLHAEHAKEFPPFIARLSSPETIDYLEAAREGKPETWTIGFQNDIIGINLLRQHKIPPLILEERNASVDGRTLRDMLDFLCQATYVVNR